MQESQQAKAMAQPKAPPIAQQVMQQAMATEGVQALPSNMPEQYAQGGILHYAEGDLVDDDNYDEMMYDDQMSEAQKQIAKIRDEMMANQAQQSADVGSASYGGIDYSEAPNPQVEYHRTPNTEVAKVSKGTPSNFESMALARGKAHGVDEHLVRHVMHKETGGLKDRANAVSPAGAIGVMQLMPATAKDLGVRNPYDPEQNIEGGVKYLAQLQRKYHDPKLAAIAYNWGPGNTDKWLMAGADPSKLPRETQRYTADMAGGGAVHFGRWGR
jgi:soluble lytic murein transglycosylase-like protein